MGVGGGYAATLLAGRAMARTFPLDGGEAAIAASLAAWLVHVAMMIWVFAVRGTAAALVPPILLIGALFVAGR